ncbi:sucrase/ferredoxin domain-containing protein [Niveomyces insectorum RCEF 264]|uniref:Defect at low temperature protein 1 n=1 Tax=Niveomyces insectorum RCEF 264 TaxID=1081102 RepID=A0A167QAF0_9HYPO|nr:sucrase/ferredoxin domain-containing protein [Niveomyces insectorum RCEF 264]
MASSLSLFFRIVYGIFYSFLHLLLLALLLVTPGDIINQARTRHNIYPILIVAACYVASILIVIFVYFARLYINRSVLNAIPKSWVPVEKGDVRAPVRKMIAAGLSRSAAIAFVSRPRILPEAFLDSRCGAYAAGKGVMSGGGGGGGAAAAAVHNRSGVAMRPTPAAAAEPEYEADRRDRIVRFKHTETVEKEMGIALPPFQAVWGDIEHNGWAPPVQPQAAAASAAATAVPDAAGGGSWGDLQYDTVIAELPSLIEAKALTLAPPDPASPTDPPALDAEAVALLQRPANMGLRDYLAHLADLGVLDVYGDLDAGDPEEGGGKDDADGAARPLGAIVSAFVATYEYARFSTDKLSHAAFRQLMRDLATILRRMTPLDPHMLLGMYENDDADDADDADDGGAYDYSLDGGDERSLRSGRDDVSFADSEDDADHEAARFSSGAPSPSLRRRRTRPSDPTQPRPHPPRLQNEEVVRYGQPSIPPRGAAATTRLPSVRTARSGMTTGSSRSRSRSRSSSSSSQGSTGTSRRRQRPHRPSRSAGAPSAAVAATASGAVQSTSRGNWQTQTQSQQPSQPQPQGRFKPRKTRRKAPGEPRPRTSSSQSSSANSFAQSRNPYTVGNQDSSSSSLRSSSSSSSSSASSGSVIRLSERGDQASLHPP